VNHPLQRLLRLPTLVADRLVGLAIYIYKAMPFKPFLKPVLKLYSIYNKNRIIIARRDNITYELHLNELIDSAIYYRGCFEPETTRFIERYCHEGMTVFDVGANIGCHTLRFAKLVSSKGKVFAFEPMSWAFSKLKRNLELNHFDNVTIERLALGNKIQDSQSVEFACSWPLDRGAKTSESEHLHLGQAMRDIVSFTSIDEYVRVNGINNIDLIKLDVDGYEFQILQGAKNVLYVFKPLLLIELGVYTLRSVGDEASELVAFLQNSGYNFYSERDGKKFHNGDAVISSIPSDSAINIIASHSDLVAFFGKA
jgi:FkbM family methyltransferase